MEKELKFIIALPRAYRLYHAELKRRYDDSVYHFLKFLKDIGFTGLIEQVMTAACMYPRSQQECEDAVSDLGFAIVDTVDTDYGTITNEECEMINQLVQDVGREILTQLSAAGYYDEFPRDTYLARQDLDYNTNMTGIAEVEKLRDCVFSVKIRFYYSDSETRFNRVNLHDQSRMVH